MENLKKLILLLLIASCILPTFAMKRAFQQSQNKIKNAKIQDNSSVSHFDSLADETIVLMASFLVPEKTHECGTELVQSFQLVEKSFGQTCNRFRNISHDKQLMKKQIQNCASDEIIKQALSLAPESSQIAQTCKKYLEEIEKFKIACKKHNNNTIKEFLHLKFAPTFLLDNKPVLLWVLGSLRSSDFSPLEELAQIGADFNLEHNNQTPLSMALAMHISSDLKQKLIEYLMQHGAQLNPSTKYRSHGTDMATSPDTIVPFFINLLEQGYNANSTVGPWLHEIPLIFFAIQLRSSSLVKACLDKGASTEIIRINDPFGRLQIVTPQQFAKDDPEIVKIFEEHDRKKSLKMLE